MMIVKEEYVQGADTHTQKEREREREFVVRSTFYILLLLLITEVVGSIE